MRAYLRKSSLKTVSGCRGVIFLDRDGVINRRMPVHCHVLSPEDLVILPGVCEALSMINEAGYLSVIITNQRCISLGTLDIEGFSRINDKMLQEFAESGAFIDALYYCPHGDDDGCSCRKPKPGLLEEAQQDLLSYGITVDKTRSWMIGDDDGDIIAGQSFGVNTIKLGESLPDLLTAVRSILADNKG